jgi:hypothetical protein
MREPRFTETKQLGIVVRDLDATIRTYVDDYGIGLRGKSEPEQHETIPGDCLHRRPVVE